MLGGTCVYYEIIERIERGDQTVALNACFLWRIVNTGKNLKRVDTVEIAGGVTVGDVIAWVSSDYAALHKERRLLLLAAGTILADKAVNS